ncbi:LytR/AlgR family response regulator transcription factor [Chryseolinea serpens]|nr:LytTR family DNA-binding domain-containing protein [Chryseolinea serpens]
MIIDDEPLAQTVIETYIQRVSYLSLVAKCENAVDAFDVFQNESIDLIFCDIQMPQITGIEFVKSLKQAPHVIFTTAYSEYAIEGFNVDAVDYLLKPVAFDRFLRSVQKVKHLLSVESPSAAKVEAPVNHLFVKEDYKLVKINHSDILYIEGMKDYVKIYAAQKMIITHITMKRLEELLPLNSFYRSHKSFIVRLDAINSINGNEIEIINKSKIPIGVKYRDGLMGVLKNIN